jgi:hypothetical protein
MTEKLSQSADRCFPRTRHTSKRDYNLGRDIYDIGSFLFDFNNAEFTQENIDGVVDLTSSLI